MAHLNYYGNSNLTELDMRYSIQQKIQEKGKAYHFYNNRDISNKRPPFLPDIKSHKLHFKGFI